MVRNPKMKGTNREHRSIAILEAAGFRCVRSAASGGVWDIVGIGTVQVLLVQVKSRDWPGVVELEAMREFPVPPNVVKLIHRWRDRQRSPDVKRVE